MPTDLYAERLRVVSGSSNWTVSTMTGSNPNGIASEPTGSLLRTPDGGIWINSNGGTEWQRLGAGVVTGSYTATGVEGSQASVTLPVAFNSSQYRVFITNVSGSTVSSYQVPEALRTASTFKINSTSPFVVGDKLDYLAMSGSIYSGAGSAGGSSTTPSIVITTGLAQSAGALNTLGNVDWLHVTNIGANAAAVMGSQSHSKKTGGWLRRSFVWVNNGSNWGGGSVAGTLVTATAADSVYNTALSTQHGQGPQNLGSVNGNGFMFSVPCAATAREVRWYSGNSGNLRITCTIQGLAAVTALDTGGGGEARITYQGTGEMTVSAVTESASGTVTIWLTYIYVKDA